MLVVPIRRCWRCKRSISESNMGRTGKCLQFGQETVEKIHRRRIVVGVVVRANPVACSIRRTLGSCYFRMLPMHGLCRSEAPSNYIIHVSTLRFNTTRGFPVTSGRQVATLNLQGNVGNSRQHVGSLFPRCVNNVLQGRVQWLYRRYTTGG